MQNWLGIQIKELVAQVKNKSESESLCETGTTTMMELTVRPEPQTQPFFLQKPKSKLVNGRYRFQKTEYVP